MSGPSRLLAVMLLFYCLGLSLSEYIGANNKDFKQAIHVDVGSSHDPEHKYTLKLVKADESLLHPDIKIISLGSGDESQSSDKQKKMLHAHTWTPTKAELTAAQNLYLDHENLAAIRLAWDEEKGEHVAVTGVVNGNKVDGGKFYKRESFGNRTDYIDIGRNLTGIKSRQDSNGPAIVEVVLVCDKEFGDKFNHDRKRILEYFTVYFWDINLRYKTLPSLNLSFRLNAIIVINSLSGQPFIEEARAEDGRAEFGRILWRFRDWIYEQMQTGGIPRPDIAIAITNTNLEWGGGLAYMRAACGIDDNGRHHWGTSIWNDDGSWWSVTVGAHEIGHNLGAPHDTDESYPGGCEDRGYIMSGGTNELRYFFSTCSDRTIGEFVRSDQASCLRRIEDPNQSPAISPDFGSVQAPSMSEQCRRRTGNQKAFLRDEDRDKCQAMPCWVYNDNGWYTIYYYDPVDNTPCTGANGSGRCFRGRCRRIGNLLRNVQSGQCARAQNPFNKMTWMEMVNCPDPKQGATPLDKFVVQETQSNGKVLMTPYNSPDGKENEDKCVQRGDPNGDWLWTDKCNLENTWMGWDLEDVGSGQVLLKHRNSGKCAKQDGRWVSSGDCNRDDRNMRWILEPTTIY